MQPILEIQNISKKFRIGQQQQAYATLRETLQGLFSKKTDLVAEFWALDDIFFNVHEGESMAIIGRNGAGKSTLLKIISKITPPTKGKIISRGRVASLLEVGTGFHPELTGKENIYLNGSILGLTKGEINSKYDEIIEFSGVEKFLETPLKHYSSGMQLRLAFSVAAHLEPEILAIDEVLAVGDSLFQQKCIAKMTEVSKSGRTILFVSHNFTAVQALCQNAIVLEEGKQVFEGTVEKAIDYYNSKTLLSGQEIDLANIKRGKYAEQLIFDRFSFERSTLKYGEDLVFNILLKTMDSNVKFNELAFGINVCDKNNNNIYHISNQFLDKPFSHSRDEQAYHFRVKNNLKPDTYRITLFLTVDNVVQDWLPEIIEFKIEDGNPYNYKNTEIITGVVFPEYEIDQIS